MSVRDFGATATWGSRREVPEALADRWIKLITRLQAIDPVFAHWYYWPKPSRIASQDWDRTHIIKFIESNVGTNDADGSPQPLYGYSCFAINTDAGDGPRSFSTRFSAGTGGPYCFNNALVSTSCGTAPDPLVVTYKVFRGIVLALGEAFEPARVIAYPVSILDFWPKGQGGRPIIKLAWITYVGPSYAHLITPPSEAIVERQPDGGLLMAATKETFDVSNPTHMAAARAIEAAAAPFNAFTKAEMEAVIAKGCF
ncbi:MAG TPA: Imm52 family immunity protein [Methylocella sp.]|nr:Imm52 family immunity protein [Methylocella sp.]